LRVRAWFGTVEDGKCVSRTPVLESDESVKQFNDSFRNLASICGVRDYIGELHDLMVALTKEALRETSFDIRVIELVNFLDELNESISALQDMNENSLHPPPPSFEEAISALKKAKEDVEMEILKEMRNHAPNLSEVAGELIGARLISIAGSLKRLASLPSTSVQILGAERALFKHLQRGTPPPKHGVIYLHPLLKGVKKKRRGKVAKIIARFISIAARADAFSGRLLNLREEMEKEVEEALR